MFQALPILLFSAADTSNAPNAAMRPNEIQEIIMHRLINFTGIRSIQPGWMRNPTIEYETLAQGLAHRRLITNERSSTKVCDWYGVKCECGVIAAVHWANLDFCPHYAWLPSTCKDVSMEHINKEKPQEFFMAFLPRELRRGVLASLKLYGTVNLSKLPRRIVSLNMSNNDLRGTADLTRLPLSLKSLYLQKNPISCCVYDSCKLPESLSSAFLSRAWGDSRTQVVCLSDRKSSKIILQ